MAFDYVSRDFRRVARCKVAGYAEALPDGLKISRLLDRDGKPGVLEMSHPTSAAAAIRILVNGNG